MFLENGKKMYVRVIEISMTESPHQNFFKMNLFEQRPRESATGNVELTKYDVVRSNGIHVLVQTCETKRKAINVEIGNDELLVVDYNRKEISCTRKYLTYRLLGTCSLSKKTTTSCYPKSLVHMTTESNLTRHFMFHFSQVFLQSQGQIFFVTGTISSNLFMEILMKIHLHCKSYSK